MADKEQVVEYLKKVTADLRRTRQRVRDLEDAAREPIAIVGMSCRFPGRADTPEAFWELLSQGIDATTEYPADRGWQLAGVSGGRGGFIDTATEFAAGFFGVSPREALEMDPQQRVLLEASWEVFERAGIDPGPLRGSKTGVFVGVNGSDYGALLSHTRHQSLGYLLTGTAASVVSGRVAFTFGFEGPAVTVDTACSASLVSLHLAAQALRGGECSLALVGGVTVMSTPGVFDEFGKQGGMSGDGRCKAFAASADGTAWGEGVGLLLVERLSDAARNGHEVLAVVRGSAVNQDGASNGLTAPNGPSQQRVIEDALSSAALASCDVDVVEAHGTGTTLGDPIEAQALLATYGRQRDIPLWLGSVKSNIGHTQAAAGVAGVIKMVMAMRHGVVPRTLHVDEPTPHVDWSTGAVELATEQVAWPETGRPRRAAVSSFGISGTNAHVILEQAAQTAESPIDARAEVEAGPLPWMLSARTPAEIPLQAAKLLHFLASGDAGDAGVAAALVARPSLEHRAVVVARDRTELDQELAALAARERSGRGTVQGAASPDAALAVVFSGQGSQWTGMGKQWYAEIPAFATAFDAVCVAVDHQLDVPLAEIVFGDDETLLAQTKYAQVALFAVEVALFRTLAAWGVRPSVLLGHSVGEIAAAHVAGVLSLADAGTLAVARGALMQDLPAGGVMLAVRGTEPEVTDWLGDSVEASIAAVNGPDAVVVSGTAEAVREVERQAEDAGRRTRYLKVSHAFHSPCMEPMLAAFETVLHGLAWSPPQIPIISTVTGALLTADEVMSPGYWVRHARDTVRFRDAVAALEVDAVVELGPHAVLTSSIVDSAVGEKPGVTAVGHRDRPQTAELLRAVAMLWTAGVPVDWRAVLPATAERVTLPTYAFDRKRFWPKVSHRAGDVAAAGLAGVDHPLLAAAVSMADGDTVVLTGRMSPLTHPWLADHAVLGSVLLPGTAFVELVLRAGQDVGCPSVRDLTVETPLVLGTGATQLQVVVAAPDADGERAVSVHSRPDGSQAAWTCHANAVVQPSTEVPGEFAAVTGAWPPPGATPVGIDGFYPALLDQGYRYGPAFQGLRAVWRRGHEVFADVTLPDDPAGFGIHPALLDAALHPMGVLDGADTARVPFAWTGVRLLATGARSVRVAITAVADDVVRIRLADQAGAPVIGIDELVVRPVNQIRAAIPVVSDALFVRRWEEFAPVDEPCDDGELVLLDCTSLPVTASDVPARAEETVAAVLARIHEWLADADQAGARLAVLTRSGVVVGDDDQVDPTQAAVVGLVRSANAEHPDRFLIVDLDTETIPEGALAAAVAAAEPEIAVRGNVVFVPRLARAAAAPETPAITGPVLVTGGTGVIGAAVAEHLVTAHGVTSLVLAGRRGPQAPLAEKQSERLRELGADVRLVACDLADREQVAALIAGIPGLRGVVHSAGIVDDGVVEAITPERLARVMRPKSHAAWYLHELTAELDLDLFVLFSSAAGVFGSPGQANYAAANTFLDALAEHRRTLGLPAYSMAWGLWADTSAMTGTLGETDRRRLDRAGLRPLSAAEGVALFDAALRLPGAVSVPVRLDLRASGRPPALLRPLVKAPLPSAATSGSISWHDRMRSAPDLGAALTDAVRHEVAIVLGHGTAADVAADESFSRLGFDSLTAVELRNRLTDLTGVRLPATLVFDYPSPDALAAFLGEQFGPATAKQQASGAVTTDEPIAIIGMSCRYPGGVRSPEDLWDLVVQRREGLGPFPQDRGWDLDSLFAGDGTELGTTYVREGGFLYDAAEFDPAFFGISPREAAVMDPQHRLLLELAWEVIERAGIDAAELRGSRTGMYGGLMYHDYAARLRSIPPDVAGFLSGSAGSVATGRVAYSFGFEGPAVTVDTACSSSLVALDMAVSALRRGEIDFAVAGGVTVLATPTAFTEFGRQRGLAPDGRCKAFSASADGTAWSEGIGLLMVERLSDARRNGHPVLAVVRGCSVNQDGASNGMTAPNGPSQQRVIRRALLASGLDVSDVDVVEAHGTGTALGDPIEAQAVLATYGQDRPADRPVLLGSVKSNIGHTQAAAGVAGVIKMVMALRHGVVPATLHVTQPSTHVDWTAGAVELVTDSVPWPATGRPRRAAVSSFGISGTNAHVILEQAPPTEPLPRTPAVLEPGPVLPWVLSAKSAAGLAAQAERLREAKGTTASLSDVAAALAGTRTALDYRGVVLATDRDGFVAGLDALSRHEYSEFVIGGTARTGRKVAFVFSGEGTHWATPLLTRSRVFAESMARCGAALSSYVDWTLPDVLGRADVPEAARWAVMVSMAELWRAVGVTPAAVISHGTGGIAAACVAGELSLDDAARLITGGEPWEEPMSFADEVRTALGSGLDTFVEMSPPPVLSETIAQLADGPVHVIGSCDHGELGTFLRAAATLWTRGVPVDWSALLPRPTGEVDLPTYAFHRQRYWMDATEEPVGSTRGRTQRAPDAAQIAQGARIRDADPQSRTELLVQLVQTELAILRRDDSPVDPGTEFLELGVDSMLGIELAQRLDAVLGLSLASTTMFEYSTTARLAEHLAVLVQTVEPVSAPDRSVAHPPDSLEALFRESYRLGVADSAGMQLIRAAAVIRPSFTADAVAEHVPEPVRLVQGGGRTMLVCLPAITATAGPVQYARMSQLVKGTRDVVVLPNPGFTDGQLLPDSFRAFIALQVHALRAAVGGEPFVLLGHSAGGLIAYAVAGAAERAGLIPAGVVLLDTFGADAKFSDRTTEVMFDGLFAREHILGADALSSTRLTAMGRYYTLTEECELDPVASPTFFLRAEDPLPYQDEVVGDWRATWPFPHTLEATTGDHFTLMEDHIAETTAAVERWLISRGI